MKASVLRRGFTLIEILVVVAIIGILSAVLYANFGTAREDSLNKAMQSELKEVQLALELYKAQTGRYPDVPPCGSSADGVSTARSTVCTGSSGFIAGLTPDFIADLPDHEDSANDLCDIVYSVDDANQTWYKLTGVNCHGGATTLTEGVQADDELARCPSSCPSTGACVATDATFYRSYAVYSAGGECR